MLGPCRSAAITDQHRQPNSHPHVDTYVVLPMGGFCFFFDALFVYCDGKGEGELLRLEKFGWFSNQTLYSPKLHSHGRCDVMGCDGM